MKYKKIVLAGGNGYLGHVLAKYSQPITEKVIILSRKQQQAFDNIETVIWDGQTEREWVKFLEDADILVNLCGKNVNCRYTVKNKKEIFDSRLKPTDLLNNVIISLVNPPKLFINIASATIYRHAEDYPQDELTGEIGGGFSVAVCQAWERAFFETNTPKTRKAAYGQVLFLEQVTALYPGYLIWRVLD